MGKKTILFWGQTLRSFKKQKRKEFKRVRSAIKDLHSGCAYMPKEALNSLCKARELLEESYKICKPWWKRA